MAGNLTRGSCVATKTLELSFWSSEWAGFGETGMGLSGSRRDGLEVPTEQLVFATLVLRKQRQKDHEF